jgi:glycosyltransferase involved in cell wall biosynthesis
MQEIEKKDQLPFVTALLVTKNEQDYIETALMSYINQTYPKDRYEIIVIDGESTDNTLNVVKGIKEEYETEQFRITVLNNPKHILSTGWNIGIKAAKGEYVIRIDAHAKAYPDTIMKSMETMLRVDATCVGGKLITKSINGNNDVISKVLSSPFGVGNSSFRVSDKSGFMDTAVYGLYKKMIFDKVGFFNEKYIRNQDLQMHSRIRKVGGSFYFNPEIMCEYYTRNTIKKMVKQAFGNGKWNMVLFKEDKRGLSIRHLVPFAFVVFLIASTMGGFFLKPIWIFELSILGLYFVLGLIFGIKSKAKVIEVIEMPLLFFFLHTSYGIGYLSGIVYWYKYMKNQKVS